MWGICSKMQGESKSKAEMITEAFLVHDANRVKADCKKWRSICKPVKPTGRACNRWRGHVLFYYLQAFYETIQPQSSLVPWDTCPRKREAWDREENVISLSGRLAHVGCEGFRHKPHHSVPSNFVLTFLISRIWLTERANAVNLCSSPACWCLQETLSGC